LLTLLYHISNFHVVIDEIRNQTIKDHPFAPVHGKAQLSTIIHQPIDCGEIGSTLSPEERQLLECN